MIDYIIVAVKEKNDLDNILSDLNEYIVRKTDSSEYVLNHNLGNFFTYIGVQKGYTKILSDTTTTLSTCFFILFLSPK